MRRGRRRCRWGISLSYWDDNSEYLKARLGTLLNNGIQGSILVILLLTMFLRPAVALWVFIGIPASFLGALLLLPFTGVTINMISLFGFIIVLGIVVDDAIVTGENIYTRLRAGEDPLAASVLGTKQVAVPVTFGILTTIAAFSPLAFVEGRMGDFMGAIPAVVIPCLVFSLVESKLVLPAHMKTVRIRNEPATLSGFSGFQQRFADGFEQFIVDYYRPLLRFSLANRYSVIAAFLGGPGADAGAGPEWLGKVHIFPAHRVGCRHRDPVYARGHTVPGHRQAHAAHHRCRL